MNKRFLDQKRDRWAAGRLEHGLKWGGKRYPDGSPAPVLEAEEEAVDLANYSDAHFLYHGQLTLTHSLVLMALHRLAYWAWLLVQLHKKWWPVG